MTKKERQRRQKSVRASRQYALLNRVTAVRFTEPNLAVLNEYSIRSGVSRNRIINAMIAHCASGQFVLSFD